MPTSPHSSVRRIYPVSYASDIRDPALAPRLLRLHRAVEALPFWRAAVALIDASLPVTDVVAALPFEGTTPMAFLTTLATKDIEGWWLKLNTSDPPLVRVVAERPGLKLADLDEVMPERELKRSRFWKRVMKPEQWRHSVALLFWDEGRYLANLALCRTAGQGPFTPAEKELLLGLHPHLDAAIHRVARFEREKLVGSLLREALDDQADGVALVDAAGRVVFHNRAAAEACATWTGGREGAARRVRSRNRLVLPEAIVDGCRELMGDFLIGRGCRRSVGTGPSLEIAREDLGLMARLSVVASSNRPVPPHIRIEFGRRSVANRSVPVFRLSRAEQRVALLVARGGRNAAIAGELGVSIHTVRAHLREVFSKLGIRHRGQLSQALGMPEAREPI